VLAEVVQHLAKEAIVQSRPGRPIPNRPKLQFGVSDGRLLPLYNWGQLKSFFGTIGPIPSLFEKLRQRVIEVYKQKGFGEECFPNHVLLTWYESGKSSIPAHADAGHSEQSVLEGLKYEKHTPVAIMSLLASRRYVVVTPDAPATADAKKLANHVLWSHEFQHGDLLLTSGSTNVRTKHSLVLNPEIKEMRVAVTFRRCALGVDVAAGSWELNGERRLVANCKDSLKVFTLQPSWQDFCKKMSPALQVKAEVPPRLDVPPPAIDAQELFELVLGELNKHWMWGADMPHYSAYAGWTFSQVLFLGAGYLQWIVAKASTRPVCWPQFQQYHRSIVESAIYRSLEDAFVDDASKIPYLRDLLGNDLKEPEPVSDWFGVPDDEEIAMASKDIEHLSETEIFVKAGHEKLAGMDFEFLLKADPVAAKRFATYTNVRLAPKSNAGSAVSTQNSLPQMVPEPVPEPVVPEPEVPEHEVVQPKAKGKAKAKAKASEGPASKRPRNA